MKSSLVHRVPTRRWLKARLALAVLLAAPLARADAPAGRYTVTGDTVRDTKTDLTWQRVVPPGGYTWANAVAYCADLNFGGYPTGWRLPNTRELFSLIDRRAFNPAIDTAAFPDTPNEKFWSSSINAGEPSYAWNVNFDDGTAYNNHKGFSYRVRCVR